MDNKNIRGKRITKTVVLFLAILLLLPVYNSSFAAAVFNAESKPQKGVDFSLYDLKGNNISFQNNGGKPVIIFFWATWCPFCADKFPMLIKEYNNIRAKGIEFLAVNINEPKDRVENFLKKFGAVEFSVLLDEGAKVAYAYNLVGVPTFILIDSQGMIKSNGNQFPADYADILCNLPK